MLPYKRINYVKQQKSDSIRQRSTCLHSAYPQKLPAIEVQFMPEIPQLRRNVFRTMWFYKPFKQLNIDIKVSITFALMEQSTAYWPLNRDILCTLHFPATGLEMICSRCYAHGPEHAYKDFHVGHAHNKYFIL